MNSKIFICILVTLILCSCGVKGPPLKHPETDVDSYIETIGSSEVELEKSSSKKKN